MELAPPPTAPAEALLSRRPAAADADRNAFPVPWRAAVVCGLLALAVYAVTLGGTYVYDDVTIIRNDPRIADPALWGRYLNRSYNELAVDNLYRPLTSLSFAVQWWLHGDRPWAFHLVNVVLHAGATAAVAAFVGQLWGKRSAWAAGVLFAVHPVHVEAVAGLVGRAESICMLATFAGLRCASRRPLTPGRVGGVVACFLVALLSKEQGVLYPFLVIALLGLRHWMAPPTPAAPRATPRPKPRGGATPTTWAVMLLVWILAGYLNYRESILRFYWDRNLLEPSLHPMIKSVGVDRALMPLVLTGRYAVLLVAPAKLYLDYGGDTIGPTVRYHEPYFYLGVLAVLMWAGLLIAAVRRRSWPLAFCLVGFALCYGLVSNAVVLIGTILGERLMYMPSAFFVAIVAAGFSGASPPRRLRWAVPLLVLVAAFGVVRTVTYAWRWNDRDGLYRYCRAQNPRSVMHHALVWELHMKARDWAGAFAVAREAQRELPDAWEPDVFAAKAAIELDDVDAASAAVDLALKHGASFSAYSIWHRVEARKAEKAAATRPATIPAGPTGGA